MTIFSGGVRQEEAGDGRGRKTGQERRRIVVGVSGNDAEALGDVDAVWCRERVFDGEEDRTRR